MKKYFSMTLFLAIAMSMLSFCILVGNAAAEGNKVADLPTLHDYNTFFDDGSTDFAGIVWTDKSVFTDIPEDVNKQKTIDDVDISGLEVEDDSFLVALSAAASTKSITGYELTPTDTVFVLDVSGSMKDVIRDGNIRRIDDLKDAANTAIHQLLNKNYNNRIGVVLFSGITSDDKTSAVVGASPDDSSMVLLPLGRYQVPEKDGKYEYLQLDTTKVKVEDNGEVVYKTVNWLGTNASLKKWNGEEFEEFNQAKMAVEGATYIQHGLYRAWDKIFEIANPKVQPGDSEHGNDMQIGVTRIPVLILMGDGAPTSVSTNYAPEQNTPMGAANGGSGVVRYATNDMAFLTQLTAGWVKNKIGSHYNNGLSEKQKVKPLFYTVGVGLNNTSYIENTTDHKSDRATSFQARHIMQPEYTWEQYQADFPNGIDERDEELNQTITNRINSLWTAFKNVRTVTLSQLCSTSGYSLITDESIINISYNAVADNRYYVNKYFNVDDGENMTDAFQSIIREIELQSRYTATEVEDTDGLYSGYVTFVDKIGEHMEVRDIKGLIAKNGNYRLFTGESFANLCTEANFGNWFADNSATSEGYLLVTAIATRLGLNTAIGSAGRELVCNLINEAYKAGQLGGPEKGHSFGWYADEKGHILERDGIATAFWNFNKPNVEAPPEAEYRIRSYLYYDKLSDNSEDVQRNTLFVSVQVREKIADGEISVVWRVPSNMLPMNEYKITLSQNEGTPTATGSLETELPIRLLYEVGMKEGYRSHEIEETIANLSMQHVSLENVKTDHKKIVEDEAGSYYFYTNSFDTEVNPQDLTQHPTQERNTLSYYEPSRKNERFRFTKETDILERKDSAAPESVVFEANGHQYVQYKGNEKPALTSVAQEKYYFMRRVFEKQGNGDTYAIKTVPGLIRKPSLEQTLQQRGDGSWYIPVGTIEYPQSGIMEQKASNKTNTFEYSDAATVEIVDKNYPAEGIAAGEYIISSILGNNGRLKVTPDRALRCSRKLRAEHTTLPSRARMRKKQRTERVR